METPHDKHSLCCPRNQRDRRAPVLWCQNAHLCRHLNVLFCPFLPSGHRHPCGAYPNATHAPRKVRLLRRVLPPRRRTLELSKNGTPTSMNSAQSEPCYVASGFSLAGRWQGSQEVSNASSEQWPRGLVAEQERSRLAATTVKAQSKYASS